MALKRKLYIISIVFLAITILSQVFVESTLFESFNPENSWDNLGLALKVTMSITIPSAIIALGSFIAATIISFTQRKKTK